MPGISLLLCLLSACGGGGGGGGGGGDAAPVAAVSSGGSSYSPTAGGYPPLSHYPANAAASCAADTVSPPAVAAGTLGGQVQFERVPPYVAADFFDGLAYSRTTQEPARGVVVEVVDGSGGQCSANVLATALTDGDGEFLFSGLDDGRPVCVRARAQLWSDAWDVQVTDNTAGNAPYYLVESAPATPAALRNRNLLARSGWGGVGYTSARAAAPFAIADTVCTAFDRLQQAQSGLMFPRLFVRWSVGNKPADGDLGDGDIGTTFFRQLRNPLMNELFLRGAADNDTDEYDQHVIIHELAHYVSANLVNRIDSLGGPHSLDEELDFTVAFEEGWANAFAGMMLDEDPAAAIPGRDFIDTYGFEQRRSFLFNLSGPSYTPRGWFNESSVHTILYQVYDPVLGLDQVQIGFDEILAILTGPNAQTEAMTSIFSFVYWLKQRNGDDADIDALTTVEDIEPVVDEFGTGEDNAAPGYGYPDPVFSTLAVGPPGVTNLCSHDGFGTGNNLYNYRYLRFTAGSTRRYIFNVSGGANAGVELYRRGFLQLPTAYTGSGGTVAASYDLNVGNTYVMVVYHEPNTVEDSTSGAQRCFNISVQ